MPNVKDTVQFLEESIENCWMAQRELLDEEQPEYRDLQSQVNAYQEVYAFLTGDEFDGTPSSSKPIQDDAEDDDEDEDETYDPEPSTDDDDEEEPNQS